MRAVVIACVGLMAVPVAARAADLPARTAPPVFVAPVAAPFSWTGFYIGVNAGYGFGSGNSDGLPTGLTVAAAPVGTYDVRSANGASFLTNSGGRKDGFVGGGQIGYNYQFGAGAAGGVVIGVEADFDYSALRGESTSGGIGTAVPGGYPRVAPQGTGRGIAPIGTGLATAPGNVAFFSNARRGPGDFLGTIRGRLGYAFGSVLVYGTGGFAYTASQSYGSGGFGDGAAVPANFYTDFGARAAGAAVAPTLTSSSNGSTGYVVGGGVEYAIATDSIVNVFHSSAVTLRVEGLYYDLGRQGVGGSGIVGVTNTGAAITGSGFSSHENTFGVVRAGLNFKFGTPAPAAVVARY